MSTSPASRTSPRSTTTASRNTWTRRAPAASPPSRCCGTRWGARLGRSQEAARRDRGDVTQDGREDVHAAPRREVSADRRELDRGRARVHGEEQGVGDGGAEGVRENDGGVAEAEVGGVDPCPDSELSIRNTLGGP